MHEYAITKSVIDLVVGEAEKAGASKVVEIKLVIGDLSSIVDESVQMYFDILSRDTIAQEAQLIFKRLPARFKCKTCGNEFDKPARGFDCPVCGGAGMHTGEGADFYIESIEVQ